jgi:hypothetical protein
MGQSGIDEVMSMSERQPRHAHAVCILAALLAAGWLATQLPLLTAW